MDVPAIMLIMWASGAMIGFFIGKLVAWRYAMKKIDEMIDDLERGR